MCGQVVSSRERSRRLLNILVTKKVGRKGGAGPHFHTGRSGYCHSYPSLGASSNVQASWGWINLILVAVNGHETRQGEKVTHSYTLGQPTRFFFRGETQTLTSRPNCQSVYSRYRETRRRFLPPADMTNRMSLKRTNETLLLNDYDRGPFTFQVHHSSSRCSSSLGLKALLVLLGRVFSPQRQGQFRVILTTDLQLFSRSTNFSRGSQSLCSFAFP